MKPGFLLLFFALIIHTARANRIDHLQTKEEVQHFLRTEIDSVWQYYFSWEKTVTDTSEFGQNKFFKFDFDQNGRTDLLVNARYLFAITDRGDGTYGVHILNLRRMGERIQLLGIGLLDEEIPMVEVRVPTYNMSAAEPKEKECNLIFRYGNFMEYNGRADDREIESIHWTTDVCSDTCQVCEFTLSADGSILYTWYTSNGDLLKKRQLEAVVDTAAFNRITGITHYLNTKFLKGYYHVNWTHASLIKLEIRYEDGRTITIHDEGLVGTFGLTNLYEQFFALRKSQRWKKKR